MFIKWPHQLVEERELSEVREIGEVVVVQFEQPQLWEVEGLFRQGLQLVVAHSEPLQLAQLTQLHGEGREIVVSQLQ